MQRARDFFYKTKPSSESAEIFEKVLPIAQKLDVKISEALHLGKSANDILGLYTLGGNQARVKYSYVGDTNMKSQVFLHELIHSVTSRAMYLYEQEAKELLTSNQLVAIGNIKSIYKELYENASDIGLKRYTKDHSHPLEVAEKVVRKIMKEN